MEELGVGSLLLRGGAVLVLVAANAFFVAAEFGLVAARRTRIEEMVRQGDRRAKKVQAAHQDLYRQLSAAQLGITLASILLGYVAEDTVAVLFREWFAGLPFGLSLLSRTAIAALVAVTIVSFLHVVIGEQTPKAWAIAYPEATSRWTASLLMFFSVITRPATNLLNWSANRLLAMLGITGTKEIEGVHSPEEIVMLVRHSHEVGELEHHDVKLIEGVFEFTEKKARDVMTPRTDIVGLSIDLDVEAALDTVSEAGRSRYPVYRESLDDIVGIVHVKQLLQSIRENPRSPVANLMRDPLYVPGSRDVEEVLTDLKRLKAQMAVVLDEYGGTAGILTMEDLLEEIVGEIYDEYEEPELLPADAVEGAAVPGDTDIEDLNKQFGLEISDEEYQTIGGFVFGHLGRLPQRGDRIQLKGLVLEVVAMDGRRVEELKLVATEAKTPEAS